MAAGVVLGYLKYVLGFDSIAFKKGMSEAERELVAKQKSFVKQGQKLQSLGKNMAAFVTLPLAGLAAKGIAEAQETAKAMAQVNAALTSMGPVAGRTAGQLQAAANAFEGSSLFEADQILTKVTANMLTFGNISGTAFDRAQQAAVNLSARLGQDLQSSAVQVGKALNDPIKGVTALQRVGVSFTEQQRNQIKAMVEAGNAAGAQSMILKELEKQFGGAAQAAQNADPFNKLNDAFKNMAEAVGTALLPVIPPLTNALTGMLNAFSALSPETQKWILIVGGGAAVLGPVVGTIGTLMKVLGPLLPLLLKLAPAWVALKTALVAARVAAIAALPALTPFLVPLGAIALAVGAVYLAWKNWDKITAFASAVYQGVKTWIQDKLGAVFEWVKEKIRGVADSFKWLYDVVVGHSYVPDMVDQIGEHIARLDDNMVRPIAKAAKLSADAFAAMKDAVAGVLQRLFPEDVRYQQFLSELQLLEAGMKRLGFSAAETARAVARLRDEYSAEVFGKDEGPAWMKDFQAPDRVDIDFDPLVKDVDKTAAAIDGFADRARARTLHVIDAFGGMAQGVIGSLQDIVHAFKHGDILSGLQSILGMVRGILGTLGQLGVLKGGMPSFGDLGPGGAIGLAGGGPTVPGRTYLVGERGPEYLSFGRRGYITPPRDGGQQKVMIVPSPYFDVVVDGRASKVAAPMAGRAAIAGATGGVTGVYRKEGRRLP